MLLLFETPAGFALFTVLQENKLQEAEVGAGKYCTIRSIRHQNVHSHAFVPCRTFGAILRLWMMLTR